MRFFILLLIPFSVMAGDRYYNTPIIKESTETITNISTSEAGIASAMAAAGLHFDNTSKLQIGGGVGGYKGNHEFVIGGAYRPNLKGPLFTGTIGKDVYNASINIKIQ